MAANCDVTLVSPRQIFNSAVLEKQDIANVSPRDLDIPFPYPRREHGLEGGLDVDAAAGKSYFDQELIRCTSLIRSRQENATNRCNIAWLFRGAAILSESLC